MLCPAPVYPCSIRLGAIHCDAELNCEVRSVYRSKVAADMVWDDEREDR